MPKSESFGIIVPTRNAPSAVCFSIAEKMAAAATAASFDYHLKLLFLVNDSQPGFSADLDKVLAAKKWPHMDVAVLHSEKDQPTVEENLKNNLGPHLDLLPERFIIVGNSDQIHFDALQAAVDFMIGGRIDLLLVQIHNCESWEGSVIRRLNASPDLSLFGKHNKLSRSNGSGADIFARAFSDYGPVDYLAYIGCQIYSKAFFKALCAIHLREPLYSLPLGSLETEARGGFTTGIFHGNVVERIDALPFGPDDPRTPDNWWVQQSRVKRGLSKEIAMSVLSSSLDLGDAAFATFIHASGVGIPRAANAYAFRYHCPSLIEQVFRTFVTAHQQKDYRLAHREVLEIVSFGERLQRVDLGLGDEAQTRICSWLQRFALTEGYQGVQPLQAWVDERVAVFESLEGYIKLRTERDAVPKV